ncbi:hypothetical protein GPECTOR_1g297 [Gonium pectorale]|uniref:Uncharacterized protein n=1 Tax=Gonium pectorale TaxID=33097 RepID=A0A150H2E4_GONPE|nr:hypothetical protein GPECTOR_1g297 [Gonium pectorale]|eukprot:KXZ56336.1 hypothetical protein GPECTOR_1g297 [Gonium pectorale]
MWVTPGLLGRAIKTTSDTRKRLGGSRKFTLRLCVAQSNPDYLVVEGQSSLPGQRSIGVTKSTRQEVALLTPTSEGVSCFVDAKEFDFTAGALFEDPSVLAELLSDAKASACEEVKFTFGAATFALSGKAGDNCSRLRIALRPAAGTAITLEAQHRVQATFKARHLRRLSGLCAESSQVLLQLGKNTPLSATFHLNGSGVCQMFIAPLEDNDDDGGDGGDTASAMGRAPKRCQDAETTSGPPSGRKRAAATAEHDEGTGIADTIEYDGQRDSSEDCVDDGQDGMW